ncbi:hypothetical protein C4K05_0635 [Pseudomonas chlororaphis subsp. aureofaciens]|uniref:Uncharacterized protein n=1 Tax=Pseudomonas chlororaphis subsp. aureofaciens TaxID=587851 RepID=A0AAD0ZCV6_9PSED|nr:hypothetical protein C4K08_0611 [Pseudomonas chlororaphis subsp. aureofaciens]AZE27420.1 hypothetical protein C4K07_0608 [Pseudomonas chlororaphis subsp. aureofaciens]AZE33667.1 hypothetical protein C4K06_0607 [Pseudomonas chlororaphis subsp. aureofaciens]AZE40002.1 hypothetical protein C4K05_0635 [Pseudomonas chlororaphis subsp. aureofaciens]
MEMLLYGRKQGGRFRRGNGAGNIGHWLASSRQGGMRDMVAEKAPGSGVGPAPVIASKLAPTVTALFL